MGEEGEGPGVDKDMWSTPASTPHLNAATLWACTGKKNSSHLKALWPNRCGPDGS